MLLIFYLLLFTLHSHEVYDCLADTMYTGSGAAEIKLTVINSALCESWEWKRKLVSKIEILHVMVRKEEL